MMNTTFVAAWQGHKLIRQVYPPYTVSLAISYQRFDAGHIAEVTTKHLKQTKRWLIAYGWGMPRCKRRALSGQRQEA